MQQENAEQVEEKVGVDIVADKVDWKGMKAIKHKHGGIKTCFLILSM